MSAAPKAMDSRASTRSSQGFNPWVIAAVVSLAAFMEVLDTAIANAVVLPISGWLSIRFGRKRFYMACVVIFTVSSFL